MRHQCWIHFSLHSAILNLTVIIFAIIKFQVHTTLYHLSQRSSSTLPYDTLHSQRRPPMVTMILRPAAGLTASTPTLEGMICVLERVMPSKVAAIMDAWAMPLNPEEKTSSRPKNCKCLSYVQIYFYFFYTIKLNVFPFCPQINLTSSAFNTFKLNIIGQPTLINLDLFKLNVLDFVIYSTSTNSNWNFSATAGRGVPLVLSLLTSHQMTIMLTIRIWRKQPQLMMSPPIKSRLEIPLFVAIMNLGF